MKPFAVTCCRPLKGQFYLPGDKSIAHRAIILAALSTGTTTIRNFPLNDDCLSTVSIFRKLGVRISVGKSLVKVLGCGVRGLKKPSGKLFISESGTTFRLLAGVLCGQDFNTTLSAGRVLSGRPMSRVLTPLRLMGAHLRSSAGPRRSGAAKSEEYPPVTIEGAGCLKGLRYKMPVASAQVKSAILLAGLFAQTPTQIIEPVSTRDHTERMLALFKAPVTVKKNTIVLKEGSLLVTPGSLAIPGDISSAAFFMVAASIVCGSHVTIRNVSLNPCRRKIIDLLKRMGARIKVQPEKNGVKGSEPAGDLIVRSSALRAVQVEKKEIPALIDELPVLMVAACFAKGKTVFKGVSELRVKETDRINSMVRNLNAMGANAALKKDAHGNECIVIEGPCALRGVLVKSFGDHRTAMSMVVAGLGAQGRTVIDDISCIAKSFPDFIPVLYRLFK